MKQQDFTEEIAFWDNTLSPDNRHPWMIQLINPETRMDQFPSLLLDLINEIKKGKGERVKVLDVGAGPLSPLVWGFEQNIIDLTAVDPLAEEYSKLLVRYNISFPIRPIKGSGEKLLSLFNKKDFDIVYSRNALDHANDVKLSINNIFSVLRKGGYFYLEGHVREGTHQNWYGLHQHDLYIEDGQLLCSDKEGNKMNLASDLKFTCVHHWQEGDKKGDWLRIIFKKESIISNLRLHLSKLFL